MIAASGVAADEARARHGGAAGGVTRSAGAPPARDGAIGVTISRRCAAIAPQAGVATSPGSAAPIRALKK